MTEPYEGYAIVELMGHRRLAGRVSQAEQYGVAMLRLDVPGDDGQIVASQFYGGQAIYAVTPCTAAVAVARRTPDAPTALALPAPPTTRCFDCHRTFAATDVRHSRRERSQERGYVQVCDGCYQAWAAEQSGEGPDRVVGSYAPRPEDAEDLPADDLDDDQLTSEGS